MTMDMDNLQIVIPGSLIYQIIQEHHDSQYAAHAGVEKHGGG